MTSETPQEPPQNPKVKPGEYLSVRLMAFPGETSPPSPSVLTGSKNDCTIAYIFSYPFEVIVSLQLSEIRDLEIDGQNVTIFPPFRSELRDRPAVENIPLENLPYRQGTARPDFDWLITIADPAREPVPVRRADSLRIDCPKELSYEFAATIAEKLISLIRGSTNQWWIKHGPEHSRTHIRHWFHANELGERLGGVGVFLFLYGKIGIERVLDGQIWADVVTYLTKSAMFPLSWEIYLDAIYFHSADDLRRSVLELAISNELLLAETLEKWTADRRIERARADQVLVGNNYLAHLSRAGELWGRSFEREHTLEYPWVKAAWLARSSVAHGKPPVSQGNRLLTLDDMPSLFASVLTLRKWLECI